MKTIKRIKKLSTVLTLALVLSLVMPNILPVVQTTQTAEASTIKLTKTSLSLTVGETASLKVSGTTKKILWKSIDESIATVSSNGKVTAIAIGKTTIMARVNGKKYTCKVTIKKSSILVSNIITTSDSITVPENALFAFNATPYPTTATNQEIQWKSSDETIAKIDSSGMGMAMHEGVTNIYAYATDGSNVYAKWVVTVTNDFSKRVSTASQEITINKSEVKTISLCIPGAIANEVFYCNVSNPILVTKWGEWSGTRISLTISPYMTGTTYLTFTSSLFGGEYKIKVTVSDSTVNPTNDTSTKDNSSKISSLQSKISSAQTTLASYKSILSQYQSSLSKAQGKLALAQSQKTILVYREGQGFVAEADPKAISAAQDNVDYYQSLVDNYTNLVNTKEAEINSLQAELDALT